ncbi:hypothetical protein RB653_009998 [Dictyostelium firmibasis]|uniref:Uncharacterized protein n=1 Tax=Dictyostelium firmibasis TaxID=79012 RepID=A0AAN7YV78_9MYCE
MQILYFFLFLFFFLFFLLLKKINRLCLQMPYKILINLGGDFFKMSVKAPNRENLNIYLTIIQI